MTMIIVIITTTATTTAAATTTTTATTSIVVIVIVISIKHLKMGPPQPSPQRSFLNYSHHPNMDVGYETQTF